MALVLGRRVWENAGAPEVDPLRLAVSIGTGIGGIEELLFAYEHLRDRGSTRCISPTTVQQYSPSGPSTSVARRTRRVRGRPDAGVGLRVGIRGRGAGVAADHAR